MDTIKKGLKILWAVMSVRVQVPPRVLGSEKSGPFFIFVGSNIGRRNYSLEHSIDHTALITNTKLFDFVNTSYTSCYKFSVFCNVFLKNHSQPSIRRWENKASRFLNSLNCHMLIFAFQSRSKIL